MNLFLTDKSRRKHPLAIPGIVMIAVILAAGISVAFDDLAAGSMDDAVIGAVLDLLMAFWIYTIIRGINRRKLAAKIAGELDYFTEEEVSFERLEKRIPVDRLIDKLKTLIEKGYLTNIHLDWENREAMLNIPKAKRARQIRRIPIKCKNCGAETVIAVGQPAQCPYCDQPLYYEAKE